LLTPDNYDAYKGRQRQQDDARKQFLTVAKLEGDNSSPVSDAQLSDRVAELTGSRPAPEDMVRANRDLFREAADNAWVDSIRGGSPVTLAMLSDPNRGPISKSDVEAFAAIEQTANQVGKGSGTMGGGAPRRGVQLASALISGPRGSGALPPIPLANPLRSSALPPIPLANPMRSGVLPPIPLPNPLRSPAVIAPPQRQEGADVPASDAPTAAPAEEASAAAPSVEGAGQPSVLTGPGAQTGASGNAAGAPDGASVQSVPPGPPPAEAAGQGAAATAPVEQVSPGTNIPGAPGTAPVQTAPVQTAPVQEVPAAGGAVEGAGQVAVSGTPATRKDDPAGGGSVSDSAQTGAATIPGVPGVSSNVNADSGKISSPSLTTTKLAEAIAGIAKDSSQKNREAVQAIINEQPENVRSRARNVLDDVIWGVTPPEKVLEELSRPNATDSAVGGNKGVVYQSSPAYAELAVLIASAGENPSEEKTQYIKGRIAHQNEIPHHFAYQKLEEAVAGGKKEDLLDDLMRVPYAPRDDIAKMIGAAANLGDDQAKVFEEELKRQPYIRPEVAIAAMREIREKHQSFDEAMLTFERMDHDDLVNSIADINGKSQEEFEAARRRIGEAKNIDRSIAESVLTARFANRMGRDEAIVALQPQNPYLNAVHRELWRLKGSTDYLLALWAMQVEADKSKSFLDILNEERGNGQNIREAATNAESPARWDDSLAALRGDKNALLLALWDDGLAALGGDKNAFARARDLVLSQTSRLRDRYTGKGGWWNLLDDSYNLTVASDPMLRQGRDAGDALYATFRWASASASSAFGFDDKAFLLDHILAAADADKHIDAISWSPAATGFIKLKNTPGSDQSTSGKWSKFGSDIFSDPDGFLAYASESATESLPGLLIVAAATLATRNAEVGMTLSAGLAGGEAAFTEALGFFEEKGYDLTKEEDRLRLLSDPSVLAEVKERGKKAALIAAVVDAISSGIGSKTWSNSAIRNEVTRTALTAGVTGAGEAATQLSIGKEFNPEEVLLKAAAVVVKVLGWRPGELGVDSFVKDFARAGAALENREQLHATTEHVKTLKAGTQDPANIRAGLQAMSGGKKYYFVRIDQLDKALKEAGIDADAFFGSLKSETKADIDLARETGGFARFSFENYVTDIASTPAGVALEPYVHVNDPASFSDAEAHEFLTHPKLGGTERNDEAASQTTTPATVDIPQKAGEGVQGGEGGAGKVPDTAPSGPSTSEGSNPSANGETVTGGPEAKVVPNQTQTLPKEPMPSNDGAPVPPKKSLAEQKAIRAKEIARKKAQGSYDPRPTGSSPKWERPPGTPPSQ